VAHLLSIVLWVQQDPCSVRAWLAVSNMTSAKLLLLNLTKHRIACYYRLQLLLLNLYLSWYRWMFICRQNSAAGCRTDTQLLPLLFVSRCTTPDSNVGGRTDHFSE